MRNKSRLLLSICLLSACEADATAIHRSKKDPCTIIGDSVTLDANAYGVNVGQGLKRCDVVTVEAQCVTLVSLDWAPYRAGSDVLTANAAGQIVIDMRLHDGATIEPLAAETIPCEPTIQCCAPKKKIKIRTSPLDATGPCGPGSGA